MGRSIRIAESDLIQMIEQSRVSARETEKTAQGA
jgi:hypothetical protein